MDNEQVRNRLRNPLTTKSVSKCLTPKCDGEAKTRGLCPACYSVAGYHITRKDTTWAELIELGMAFERRRTGRKNDSIFCLTLEVKRREKAEGEKRGGENGE